MKHCNKSEFLLQVIEVVVVIEAVVVVAVAMCAGACVTGSETCLQQPARGQYSSRTVFVELF